MTITGGPVELRMYGHRDEGMPSALIAPRRVSGIAVCVRRLSVRVLAHLSVQLVQESRIHRRLCPKHACEALSSVCSLHRG
jgi:hypothetical protein